MAAPTRRAAPPPDALLTTGTYALESRFGLPTSAIVPDPVGSYLPVLEGLRDHPAETLFLVLEEAGVPLAGDLLGALPSALTGRVKGWIDDYVGTAAFEGTPVRTELDRLIEASEQVLTTFDLDSTLALADRDVAGRAAAVHRLETLRWTLYDGTIAVAVPIVEPPAPAPQGVLVREATLETTLVAGTRGADADARLGDHSFGLPYGAYALQALDQAMQARYGTDLRGALGRLINCPALAASVANRCLLTVCVGHRAELEAVCDAGLDLVAEDLRDRIRAMSFEALRLSSGTAAMWDAPEGGGEGVAKDGRIDRLASGVWTADLDIGVGPRRVPATFIGTRRR